MRERSEALPREARITKREDFERAKREGVWARGKLFDLIVAPGRGERSRIGLIIPLHSHRIVDRNKLKRRAREVARRSLLPSIERVSDIIVKARREAYLADYKTVKRELIELSRRARGE
jgi:ribonuclease P protein component